MRSKAGSWLGWVVLYALLVVVGRLSFLTEYGLALVWPAAGVGTAWALTRRTWTEVAGVAAAVLALCVSVGLAFGGNPTQTVLLGAAHALMTVLVRAVASLLTRGGLDVAAGGTWGLLVLVTSSATAAILTTPIATLAASVTSAEWSWSVPASWTLRNACSTVVIAAVLLEVIRPRRTSPSVRGGLFRSWPEELLLVGSFLGFAVLSYWGPVEVPLSFLAVALAAWVGFRHGPLVTATACLVLGVVVSVSLLAGRGEFSAIGDPLLQSAVVQGFAGLTTVVALLLSVGVAERDSLIDRLRGSETRIDLELRLRDAITANVAEAMLVVGHDDVVLFENPAADRLLGRRRAPLPELARLDGAPLRREDLPHRRVLAGEPAADERLLTTVGGSERVLDVSATRLVGFGSASQPSAVVVVRDVTSEQQADDALRQFVGVVAHDLKNPLAVVTSWTEVAQDYVAEAGPILDPDHVTGLLAKIERGSDRMRDLISDLLDHARANDAAMEISDVDLGALVADVVSDIGLEDAVVIGRLSTVQGDRRLLRHVVENLLTNAVKYVAPGVVPCVQVSVRHENPGRVALDVDDNGIGVPDDSEAIFAPFFRAHHDYPGSGLGLAICRTIIERHDGTISAHRRPTGGSRVTVALPAADVAIERATGLRTRPLGEPPEGNGADDPQGLVGAVVPQPMG